MRPQRLSLGAFFIAPKFLLRWTDCLCLGASKRDLMIPSAGHTALPIEYSDRLHAMIAYLLHLRPRPHGVKASLDSVWQ